jgi:hypothetical protein
VGETLHSNHLLDMVAKFEQETKGHELGVKKTRMKKADHEEMTQP